MGCVRLLFIWQQRRLKCKQRNILCKIGVWLSPTTSEEKMQWYFVESETFICGHNDWASFLYHPLPTIVLLVILAENHDCQMCVNKVVWLSK